MTKNDIKMSPALAKLSLFDRVLAAARIGENDDWEFKSAKGGFPGSFWETYSAMANSAGGTIVLGATEKDGTVALDGLEPALLTKHTKTLWDSLNNRGVVSRSLLASRQVERLQTEDGLLLIVRVPQATRKERPIYKGQNPFGGTFKRRHEGDYKCSDEEVRRMFADASDTPADARVLKGIQFNDLDLPSIRAFRNRFASTKSNHPWLALGDSELLNMLGGWRKDITKMLRGLVNDGLLEAENQRRWIRYSLPAQVGGVDLFNPTPIGGGVPTPIGGEAPLTEVEMQAIAARVRGKPKADRTLVQQVILELCRGQFLTPKRLSELLGRGGKKLRENYLTPMVNDGRLERLYPGSSGKTTQAYRTAQKSKAGT